MYTSHHRVFRSSFDLSRLPSPLPLSSPTVLPRRLKSRCARATGRHALRAASFHARHPTCRASRCAQHRTKAKRRGVTSSRRWADRQSLSQISPNHLAQCLAFSPPHTPPPACKRSATSHLSTLHHPSPMPRLRTIKHHHHHPHRHHRHRPSPLSPPLGHAG